MLTADMYHLFESRVSNLSSDCDRTPFLTPAEGDASAPPPTILKKNSPDQQHDSACTFRHVPFGKDLSSVHREMLC